MSFGSIVAHAGRLTYDSALKMAADIPAERFARLPHGEVGAVPTNHPAWVYGHLSLYAPYVVKYAGDTEPAEALAAPEEWQDRFGMGSECLDDASGERYPDKAEIMAQFERGYAAALEATERAEDALFLAANPNEKMRERFPTVGTAIVFMLTTHTALHAGQVSAWRRMEGLGSALKI